jgi:hypothetical protein
MDHRQQPRAHRRNLALANLKLLDRHICLRLVSVPIAEEPSEFTPRQPHFLAAPLKLLRHHRCNRHSHILLKSARTEIACDSASSIE